MAASLLAKAVVQRAKRLNVPPSSRASPLPQGICGATKSMVNTEHCGSELARESGGSAGKDFGCTAVFAGKPAPTGGCGTTKSLVNTEHCGSEPARESAGSAGKEVECAAVFAGKPAPTGNLWRHQINGQHGTLWERACSRKRWISRQRFWMYRRLRGQARSHRVFVAPPNHWSTRNIVGASLLAKAVDQPAKILDVPPSSRASPLPQGFCGITKSLVNTEHCGSEPARESAGSGEYDVECAAAFSSRLPQGIAVPLTKRAGTHI